ncbi:MAG: 3'-5' exonuclease [Planctomycetes bacterium]|nr:3'-5' exonuclease [Planctomycetota bacterium]
MDLDAASFVILDVETTGLHHQNGDRIVEVGAIKVRGAREIARYHSLVHPGIPIPPEAQRIHRITDAMILGAPGFTDIARPLRQFLAGTVLVAQNAAFDVGFLNAEFIHAGLGKLAVPALDTVALARRVRPGLSRYSLDRLADYFRIPLNGRHRSMGDCEATVQIFQECVKALRQKGEVRSIEDLIRRGGV